MLIWSFFFFFFLNFGSLLFKILGSSLLPIITWPLFADQFYNEKFFVQVLKIGVTLGAEFVVNWGEEEKFGVVLKREEFTRAIDQLMEEGEAGEERRKKKES